MLTKNLLLKCDPEMVVHYDTTAKKRGMSRCEWMRYTLDREAWETRKESMLPQDDRISDKRFDKPAPSKPVVQPKIVVKNTTPSFENPNPDKWADIRTIVPLASEIDKKREREKELARKKGAK